MFGERYFATRERLSDVMRGIAELAAETAHRSRRPTATRGNRRRPRHAVPLRRLRRGERRQVHSHQRPLRPRSLPRQHPPGNPPRFLVPLRQPGPRRGSHPDAGGTLPPDRVPPRFQPDRHPGHQFHRTRPSGNHRTFPARRRPDPVRVSRHQSMGRRHLELHLAPPRSIRSNASHSSSSKPTNATPTTSKSSSATWRTCR